MPIDLEFWKQWEGQSLDSLFPLERCTGGSSHSAVFETRFQGRSAAVKLIPGTPESIDALMAGWQKSAGLSHPALVPVLARGKAALGDLRCAYIVMEQADENLAEVLAERPLTPAEARAMLFPLIDALHYLEANCFRHQRLTPSNIMAFGDQLKVSCDSLIPGGDSAADSRAIGALLQQALGSAPNAPLPEPFAEIVRNCLPTDPACLWNLAQIEAHLRGQSRAAAAPARVRWGLTAAVAVIPGMIAIWYWQSDEAKQTAPAPKSLEATAIAAAPVPVPVPVPEADIKPPTPGKATGRPKQLRAASETKETSVSLRPAGVANGSIEQRVASQDAITRVLPEIPQAARNTIVGRVRINVRVRVDGAGGVNQATLEPPPASRYFTDRVLVAAKAWKFPAGNAPQYWLLQFELGRERTRVSPVKIENARELIDTRSETR